MHSLEQNTTISRVMDAQAADVSAENSSAVDMQNHEGVMFVAAFGALTATQVTAIKAQQSDRDDSGFADLADAAVGPLADGDENRLLVLDVKNPAKRYVRCVVERGTADAAIDGVIAIRYGPRKAPTTHDASTVAASAAVSA